ncbi:hypothetical protein BKK79_02660 [Cupriavidus sp. USMAA2-4]|uniref:EAL domain-containing protein n=1 Tax=Cupriavidus malaysiensis TaxID=367825 RepID=A0ABN4TNZ8_9BURK|nr:hypothetical protein BKK79_02660 [Cupriavidus sp. USMAA2-4]AOZ01247.1 hypothetical protein BKK81_10005 [Cupriavidus sp. USMAHM13]AOZ08079.1 hypothetical protein BKK80_10450 [Cupriavidus malaysiensis]
MPDYSFAFQPIVDVERGAVVAYEAFARRRGDRSSAHLMRALPTDAIHRFDDECRVAAMTVAERLGIRHRLHVNCFLPEQAETQLSLEQTAAAALRLGYQRGRLVLENKADEIIDRPEAYAARMQPLRDQGLKLALSEIGASSAGLNLVAAIRPDIVKLSRKTVHGVGKDGRQQRFVPQAVQLCRNLGIAVIAECVETLEQYRWLRNAGVHLFQGNLFAAPAFEAAPPARLP